ncbi:GATA transcription factor 9, partial [Haematococcus lacustris]
MQIQWYERLTNLEARYQGWTEKEHEVLEAGFLRTVTALRTTVQLAASPYIHSQLEETDVNPIGCIASKCTVFKAPNYEQAANEAARVLGPDDVWFFCRGVFRQSTGSFEPYQEFGGPAKTCSTHLATDAMSTHPPASLFSDDAGS